MVSVSELDPYYIKGITALHSRDHLQGGKPALQMMLEEAIKSKTGVEKNFTPLIQLILKQTGMEDLKSITGNIEESKTTSSSDNELELLDLMCIICQGMDVGARNRLLECSDCHSLYHQECHQPAVTQQDADSPWNCLNCKESKKAKKSPTSSSSSHSSSKSATKSSPSNTPRHSSSSHHKSSSKSSSSKSKSSSNKSSGSSSSSRHSSTTANVNIISADKRIQNMKKKAAKLHEKKKLPR